MPIGSAKIGVLGAGLVPGGTQTFNASGTFTVPPGVKKVNITGRGGTGNPGNAGNPGNPGTPGNGAGGGSAGAGLKSGPCCNQNIAFGSGGAAIKSPLLCGLQYGDANAPAWVNSPYPTVPAPQRSNKYTVGGFRGNSGSGSAGETGQTGCAGNAGTAGNPGNSGQASSGLCKTFPGGAGGNAGVAGAAGNAGTGGTGGGAGTPGPSGGGAGSGGNAGGQGGSGGPAPGPSGVLGGAGGGGGAGVSNSGANGKNLTTFNINSGEIIFSVAGGSGNPQVTFTPVCGGNDNYNASCTAGNNTLFPSPGMQGGVGAGGRWQPLCVPGGGFSTGLNGGIGGWVGFSSTNLCSTPVWTQAGVPGRKQINNYNNPSLRPEILRAGGGGGAEVNAGGNPTSYNMQVGGGGGGGGRGNAGNAGGASPTPSGSAGTPQTFNCVPVTPGSPYPITIGGPAGGQIVISWNPQ